MSKNTIKTYVLLAGLGGLLILGGQLLGGSTGAIIGLAIGLLFVGGSYWFSDKIAIAASRAKPVSESEAPELYAPQPPLRFFAFILCTSARDIREISYKEWPHL